MVWLFSRQFESGNWLRSTSKIEARIFAEKSTINFTLDWRGATFEGHDHDQWSASLSYETKIDEKIELSKFGTSEFWTNSTQSFSSSSELSKWQYHISEHLFRCTWLNANYKCKMRNCVHWILISPAMATEQIEMKKMKQISTSETKKGINSFECE